MATFETTRPAPFGAVTTFRFITMLERLGAGAVTWNNGRITRKSLARLSLSELEDIGLTPGDIDILTQAPHFGAPVFAATKARISKWNDSRLTRLSLSRLSAHELNDIGLTRADIHSY